MTPADPVQPVGVTDAQELTELADLMFSLSTWLHARGWGKEADMAEDAMTKFASLAERARAAEQPQAGAVEPNDASRELIKALRKIEECAENAGFNPWDVLREINGIANRALAKANEPTDTPASVGQAVACGRVEYREPTIEEARHLSNILIDVSIDEWPSVTELFIGLNRIGARVPVKGV